MLQIDIIPAPTDTTATTTQEGLSMLKNLSFDDFIAKIAQSMVSFAISVFIAIVVFYVGKFIIRKLYNFVESILQARHIDDSLRTFLLSFVRIVLYFILIVTVIGILGINTSSFLALFASAGVAIGMALSGTLQNFAGGVLILLLKPYKIGDFIETQGYSGTVKEIQIFSTIILTGDNKSILLPNGGLSTGSINNWSREPYRRIEWNIGISYGDSVDKAREVILGLLLADSRVVKKYIEDDAEQHQHEVIEAEKDAPQTIVAEPRRSFISRMFGTRKHTAATEASDAPKETGVKVPAQRVDRGPTVVLGELADSSVNLKVRAWVRSENYWGVFFDINEKVYNTLPQHGLSFPYPQLDVHLPGSAN